MTEGVIGVMKVDVGGTTTVVVAVAVAVIRGGITGADVVGAIGEGGGAAVVVVAEVVVEGGGLVVVVVVVVTAEVVVVDLVVVVVELVEVVERVVLGVVGLLGSSLRQHTPLVTETQMGRPTSRFLQSLLSLRFQRRRSSKVTPWRSAKSMQVVSVAIMIRTPVCIIEKRRGCKVVSALSMWRRHGSGVLILFLPVRCEHMEKRRDAYIER